MIRSTTFRHAPPNKYVIGGGLIQDLLNYGAYPVITLDTVIAISKLRLNAKVSATMDTKNGALCYEYEY